MSNENEPVESGDTNEESAETQADNDVGVPPSKSDESPVAEAVDVPDPESQGLAFGLLVLGLMLGAAIALLAPLVVVALGPGDESAMASDQTESTSQPSDEHDHTQDEIWTCPMHPFVASDQPGACPVCGMDLVLRVSSTGLDPVELAAMGRVAVSPVERVLANVATVPIGRTDLTAEIRAFGRLVYDETSYATIAAWVGGRVDRLYVQETGVEVERGQRLLSIYSPELLASQEEYLVILRSSGFAEDLVGPAERRLQLLGMSTRQIRRLREQGETSDNMRVYAPAAGTIVERLIQEGEYVTEGQPLFRLAGEQNIWVEADVHEQDVRFVHQGMQAELELRSFPGESFSGIVTLVWPFVDEQTRTLRVRIEFESVDSRFRSGMYATVRLAAEAVHQALVVPTDSVIRTGERAVVYVEIEENLFERRQVELGYRSNRLFEILDGVEEGEQVVARGGFLIDSEAQLYAGGQNLHFGHTAEEQGVTAEARQQAFEDTPLGDYFCPTDPTERGSEPGRCTENNIAWIQRNPETEYDPYADPLEFVHEHEWYCPMGTEWVASESGRCPLCGMHLTQLDQGDATAPTSQPHAHSGFAEVPVGHWFCPTNASQHSDEPGRCSSNNISYIERTDRLVFYPDSDPLTWVDPGQWYCPMGVEWVSDDDGQCPLCGLNLVELAGGGER